MSRVRTIGGNWKLNLGPAEAAKVATELVAAVHDRGDTRVTIFPTAISLTAVVAAVHGSGIRVGIQDVHTADSGAYTGANSATLARAAGATAALVGHSERRHVFGDSDDVVHCKLLQCLDAGLLATLCIGETLAQRDAEQTQAILAHQLKTGLGSLEADRVATLTLAYEPVWAIGTGRTASPDMAQEAHAFIRSWLRQNYPSWVADDVCIQYGGSMKPANAADLLSCPDIDGGLVGGAALKAESFSAIIHA
ncbi:MAG: triosephosphate isomerase [Myxococcota bacterium]|jgi:triosephosphate isomerase